MPSMCGRGAGGNLEVSHAGGDSFGGCRKLAGLVIFALFF